MTSAFSEGDTIKLHCSLHYYNGLDEEQRGQRCFMSVEEGSRKVMAPGGSGVGIPQRAKGAK